LLQIDRRRLPFVHGCSCLLRSRRLGADAAELFVVNELRYGRMRAAHRAIRILAQLQLAEAHLERVVDQKASDQRLTDAGDQLDRFCRLDDADDSRPSAAHSTLRAASRQPRRRRLWTGATIPRTFLRAEDRRLTRETA